MTISATAEVSFTMPATTPVPDTSPSLRSTPGCSPMLSSRASVAWIRGMQNSPSRRHMKMRAALP